MRKALLVAAAALGLGACTFPQTKMQPVGETQMQTQGQPAPATSAAPASGRSAAATR
jgi:hypothetical protein